jgi:hypothetical protein
VTFGLFSAGLIPLVLHFSRRQWPRVVDGEGLTLRDGTRIPWRACTHVAKAQGRTDLVFGGTTVWFPAWQIRDGKQILAEIRDHLGVGPA